MEKLYIKKTGGYDEHFIDELLDDYKCPVCLLVLCEPIQTQCGHRLCMSCSEEIKKRNRGVLICPLDTQISNSDRTFPDVAFERVILQLKVNCNNFKQSCPWTGELRLINNHLDTCEYQEINCLNDECSTSLLRKELSDHMETRCEYRSVTCQYCTQMILHLNLQGHLGHCQFFPLDCVNQCGKIILRKEMNSHTTDDCSLTITPCQFSNIGCNFKGMRKEQDDHAISSTHNHLSMAISKIALLENKISSNEKDTTAKMTSLENIIILNETKITSLEYRINSNVNKMEFTAKQVAELHKAIPVTERFYTPCYRPVFGNKNTDSLPNQNNKAVNFAKNINANFDDMKINATFAEHFNSVNFAKNNTTIPTTRWCSNCEQIKSGKICEECGYY